MQTHISKEQLCPLVEAVTKATGRQVHRSTALRWCRHGSAGVVLESSVLGGRRYSTIEAVERFVELRTKLAGGTPVSPRSSPKQRERQIDQAKGRLQALLWPAARGGASGKRSDVSSRSQSTG